MMLRHGFHRKFFVSTVIALIGCLLIHQVHAQETDFVDDVSWGSRLTGGEHDLSQTVCNLDIDQPWADSFVYIPENELSSWTTQGEFLYTRDPDNKHIFTGSFTGAGNAKESAYIQDYWSARMTVQIHAIKPFRFQFESSVVIGESNLSRELGTGLMIHSTRQSWLIPFCLTQDVYVNPWEADTSVVIIGAFLDAGSAQAMELFPGSDPYVYDNFGFSTVSGLGGMQGTLLPGVYTFYAYTATSGGTDSVIESSGNMKLTLTEYECIADINTDLQIDSHDVNLFIASAPDLNSNGGFDFFDVSLFIESFVSGCP